MRTRGLTWILSASLLLLVAPSAWGSCATECDWGPYGTSCGHQCVICRVDYPDGSCPPDEIEEETNCAGSWGCCPNWTVTSRQRVGRGAEDTFPICWSIDIYQVNWQESGCYGGQVTMCEEDWWAFGVPSGTCCAAYGCWGQRSC